MSNIHGMPGPGGSLGECQWCGRCFLFSVVLMTKHGKPVESCVTGTLFGQAMAFHADCAKEIVEFGELTEDKIPDMRDGRLKKAIVEMYAEKSSA